MMSKKNKFTLRNICTRVGGHKIHDNLNWEIEQGSYWVLAGPSGTGKTTLANIMTGLEKPTSGKVLWNNVECVNLSSLWGVQFQNSALFSDRTVLENICFGLKYSDAHALYTDQFLLEVASFYLGEMGLGLDLLHRYPSQLSGGQQKLIALARALAKLPPMLLLDEPTAGLDPATATRYDQIMSRLTRAANIGVVVITHDIQRVASADNIARLSNGMLSFADKTEVSVSWWRDQKGTANV